MLFSLGSIITVAIYWQGLSGSFFFDDHPNIVLNPGLRLSNLSVEALSDAWSSGISGQFGRPLSQLSFALNYFFGGFDSFDFKIVNLFIHCLNGWLVYLLVRELLESLPGKIQLLYVGAWASLIAFTWMAHPIQLTSVLYVVQRMTSLSALFVLSGLIFHIRARRHANLGFAGIWLLFLAWCVAWPLGILCKETAILFPGFIVTYELFVRRVERGGLDSFGRLLLILFILFFSALIPYLASPLGRWILQGYDIRSFSLAERLMTEARIIWEYIGWIVFPDLESFALFHDDIVVSRSLIDPWTTMVAILGVGALTGIVFFLSDRDPLAAFGIAWFLVGHSLESSFIPLELVHEHRNYLPLLGLCFLPIHSMSSAMSFPGWRKTLVITITGAFLGHVIFVTTLRANMYGNEQIRTQLEAQHHPKSARANYEAGRTLARVMEGDRGNQFLYVMAQKHFELAASLDLDYKLPVYALIVLDCGQTERVNQRALEELQMRLKERLILQDDKSILMSIVEKSGAGLSCLSREQIDGLFESFVRNQRVSVSEKQIAHTMHADYLWLAMKDLPAARTALSQALRISPSDSSLRLKWAQLDYIAGDKASAQQLLLKLRGERFSPEERNTLERLLGSLQNAGK